MPVQPSSAYLAVVSVHQENSAPASSRGTPDPHAESSRKSRLIGVDLARGLAVLGMFIAHIGPLRFDPHAGGAAGVLATLGEGHASILFATLAGVSLALLTGGSVPHAGPDLRSDRVRIAVRAVLLFVLGMALTQLGTPMMVILSFYGLYFLLALPVLRLRPVALAVIAAAWAIASPLISFVVRMPLNTKIIGGTISFGDLTTLPEAGSAALRLVLTGAYPVLTWMPFVLAGLAIGRLDLRSTVVRTRMLGTGVGLAVLGYGGSWLALHVFGGLRALEPTLARLRPLAAKMGSSPLELVQESNFGVVPANNLANLLLSAPHSGTPFEIVGSAGCAIAVLALCLFVGQRLRGVLAPLAAVGALALTAYTLQGVAMKFVLTDAAVPHFGEHPWLPLTGFALVTLVCCWSWRELFGRGPLEWILHGASVGGSRVLVRSRS